MKYYHAQSPGVYLGAHAIVFAESEEQARAMALNVLTQATRNILSPDDVTLKELAVEGPIAYVLMDGDY